MAVPFLDLSTQHSAIRGRLREAMDRVLESQHFILGPEVEAFEREVAAYCRCRHAVGCSSGSDALLMALMAAGVKQGDEVITTAYSFFATAGSIARLGARPVFVDIDPVSFNVASSAVEALVTPKTRAILPVHLYGQCADMAAILDVAKRYSLTVIEDAAQAIGAESEGRRAGAMGDMGCFSFYPSKNLGGFGDGGMVITNDDAVAARLRMLSAHGSRQKYYHVMVGGNFRLDALQAAGLRVKLSYLDRWTDARQGNAARYNRLFEATGLVVAPEKVKCLVKRCRDRESCELHGSNRSVLPAESPGPERVAVRLSGAPFPQHRHVYNQYVIRTGRRDHVIASLKKAQIGFEIYYPLPLHLQECLAALGHGPGSFPAAECAAESSLALPVYPELTEQQQRQVVEAVVRGVRGG